MDILRQKACRSATQPRFGLTRPYAYLMRTRRPEILRKRIENPRKPEANNGKYMENQWKTYGKPLVWKAYGKPKGNLGKLKET